MVRCRELVLEGFRAKGWSLEPIPESEGLRAVFHGKSHPWEVYLAEEPNQAVFRCLILGPLRIPEDRLMVVGEFMLRLNAMIPVGRIDLDFSQATARWVCSLDLSVGLPLPEAITSLVERGLISLESIWPELVDLAEGEISPLAALNRLHLRQLTAGREGIEVSRVDDDAVELILAGRDGEALGAELRAALDPRVSLRLLRAEDGKEISRL